MIARINKRNIARHVAGAVVGKTDCHVANVFDHH